MKTRIDPASVLLPTGPWPLMARWLWWSALPLGLLLLLHTPLMRLWHGLLSFWSDALQLSLLTQLSADGQALIWTALDDGTYAPSAPQLVLTAAAGAAVWWLCNRLPDRFYPLKISGRALCLIQWSACLFFWLAPASFPYSIGAHAKAMMDMGYGLMLATGPLLALGWGLLPVPAWQKVLAPLACMAYFALMLPHKTVLHVWCLEHLSILFMPLLFLCFGALLDLWIFIALYAWLASTAPPLTGSADLALASPPPLKNNTP
jgi:hypothetical protein